MKKTTHLFSHFFGPLSFAMLAAFLFGAFNPLGTLAAKNMHFLVYAAVATSVAGLASFVSLFLLKKPFVFGRSRVPEYLGLGLLSLAVPVALVGFAYASIPSIDLGILLRAEVIFASLFGVVFFKESLFGFQKVGLALGILGALLFSTNGFQKVVWADGAILVAALFFSTFLVFVKKLQDTHDVISITGIRCALAALVLWPFAWPYVNGFSGWIETAVLSLAIYFVGTLAYAKSVFVIGIWKTSAVSQFFSALFALLAGMFFLSESFSAFQWFCAALLLLGAILITLPSKEEMVKNAKTRVGLS